jgi:hypothetical protein
MIPVRELLDAVRALLRLPELERRVADLERRGQELDAIVSELYVSPGRDRTAASMSALAKPEDWQAAADALAAERAGRSPELFPHSLGVDPEALRTWAADDAVDTRATILGVRDGGVARLPAEVVGSALATHTQIGIEIGLWLAQTGQVSPS